MKGTHNNYIRLTSLELEVKFLNIKQNSNQRNFITVDTFWIEASTSFFVSSFLHKSAKSVKGIPCLEAQSSTVCWEGTTRATQ